MEYLGLDKQTIKNIKKTKSRWCTIFKNYPQIVMTEHTIKFLDEDSESESETESNKDKKREKKKKKEKK